jgi:hypothetical protein
MADSSHPEHANMMQWHGGRFDPAAFDLHEANRRLMEIQL